MKSIEKWRKRKIRGDRGRHYTKYHHRSLLYQHTMHRIRFSQLTDMASDEKRRYLPGESAARLFQ
jgi:hypothetical protein